MRSSRIGFWAVEILAEERKRITPMEQGVLGKIKVSPSQYFTTPVEAVMECLKKRGEEPDRCSPVRIEEVTYDEP